MIQNEGSAASLVKSVDPVFLEIANEVLRQAECTFGKIDKRILFPLADHISFAVARMKNGEQISNPLTGDIHALFYKGISGRICIEKDFIRQDADRDWRR